MPVTQKDFEAPQGHRGLRERLVSLDSQGLKVTEARRAEMVWKDCRAHKVHRGS